MAKAKITMINEPYPAKEENANIEVYITNPPSAPYIELAQITCDDTEDDWCLKQIKIKAREIGADGITILGKSASGGVGFPIGNMTSQIIANIYLNELDYYIKEELGIKYFIRYMDDGILINESKNYLKFCLLKIEEISDTTIISQSKYKTLSIEFGKTLLNNKR